MLFNVMSVLTFAVINLHYAGTMDTYYLYFDQINDTDKKKRREKVLGGVM